MKSESKRAIGFSAKLALFSVLLAIIAMLLGVVFANMKKGVAGAVSTDVPEIRTVVVDAGHGGVDGGAVSLTGKSEKVLTLSTSQKLRAVLELSGYNVVMTRTSDTELTAEGSTGSRKNQDLRGRLLVAQKYPDAVFVSIHMNKFPQQSCRGMQVYYSKNNPRSREIAERIRELDMACIDKNNDRQIKPAGTGIYLLHNIQSPAVLVECGFLSNPEEAALLDTDEYRMKLACVIFAAM